MRNKTELFYNGKIVTLGPDNPIQEAFAIEKEKFIAVGSSKELLKKYSQAVCHNLHGKTVIPGINDSHAHPLNSSLSEAFEEIPVLSSVKEVLQWVRRQTVIKPEGSWLYIHRIYPLRLKELRLPSLSELDAAAPRHPVFLNGAFGGMVNSCALNLCGINENTRHPGIVLDVKTGRPAGIVHRSAFGLIQHAEEGTLPGKKHIALVKRMLSLYNSMGITSITETAWFDKERLLLRQMAQKKVLTVRIYLNYMPGQYRSGKEVRAQIAKVKFRTGSGDEWLKIGPFKTFVDGGILTATACMLKPWGRKAADIFGFSGKDYCGNSNFTLNQLSDVILAAAEHGFNFIGHATGDGGADLLVRAYEVVNKRIPLKGKRFQLLHGNFFSPAMLRKCAAMGIVLDIQPMWLYKDLEALEALLGKERVRHFHPYREMLKQGLLVCSGSDHMAKFDPHHSINPYNPFYGLYTMVTRKTEKGRYFQPGQALTRLEALKTYTLNPAIKSGEEKIKGSIETGKLADFVVLKKDVLSCSEQELLHMKVHSTYVGGKKVFENGISANGK